jgi:hypothetical protein
LRRQTRVHHCIVVNDAPAPDPVGPFKSMDFLGASWGITGIY